MNDDNKNNDEIIEDGLISKNLFDDITTKSISIVDADTPLTPEEIQIANMTDKNDGVEQKKLFEKKEDWEEHWQNMPEFNQKDLSPFKSLIVHFANRNDMDAFAKIVGQRVLSTTQSIWFPKALIGKFGDKKYIDETEILKKKVQG